MADIFISYSKPDRDKVVMLAAYLESEGWTVWWDKNLTLGEPYRDEIMRELAAARAVIVLWTPNSIKSDFVRAEAGRGKADGRLIPVKTDDVGYGDIPLPFGEMHTESLSNKELIRAAVVAQLARPMAQPTPLWVATKTLRYQILTWFGIIGGAITVFSSLREILALATWANWIVNHWQSWTHKVWQWIFALLQIMLPPYWTPILTFTVFTVLIAVSQRVIHAAAHNKRPETPPIGAQTISLTQAVISILFQLIGVALGPFALIALMPAQNQPITIAFALFIMWLVPLGFLIYVSNNRVKSLISILAILLLYFIMAIMPYAASHDSIRGDTYLGIILSYVFIPPIMLYIAPINTLTRRLTFLALGVAILAGFNELSKYSDFIGTVLK